MFVENVHQLTDHLFRREAGKMVSLLTKIFGAENLQTAEDVVQQTFIDALQVWKLKGVPDNPSAWLFRVAKNKTIDIIRKNKYNQLYDFNDEERKLLTSEYTLATTINILWSKKSIQDDMLRMMFACCHPDIPSENQITLILKTLCGFSTSEIAKTFLTSEDTVSKRLYRTKEFFRNNKIKLEIPSELELVNRVDTVLNSIYLLFNEGYNSTQNDNLIRKELIDEATMLCKLLTENDSTQLPETFAMMALICFHSARIDSRLSSKGEIILLSKQDRKKWNYDLINEGNAFMNKAAFGGKITTYHIEAAIAYEHCIATQYELTNWKKILELYDWLCKLTTNKITELNRIVVIFKYSGAHIALKKIEELNSKTKLDGFYLYHSLLGEIYLDLKNRVKAKQCFESALELTQSEVEKKLLNEKVKSILN